MAWSVLPKYDIGIHNQAGGKVRTTARRQTPPEQSQGCRKRTQATVLSIAVTSLPVKQRRAQKATREKAQRTQKVMTWPGPYLLDGLGLQVRLGLDGVRRRPVLDLCSVLVVFFFNMLLHATITHTSFASVSIDIRPRGGYQP